MVDRILLQLPRVLKKVHYNNVLLILAVLMLFLLTGCQAKNKIADAANDLIVFVARLSLLALAVTIAGNSIMYIIRAFDGENSIPIAILLHPCDHSLEHLHSFSRLSLKPLLPQSAMQTSSPSR